MATQRDVAKYLDLGDRHVRRLVSEGVLPAPIEKGQWDRDACLRAYLKHLRASAERYTTGEGLDLVASKSLESRERTEKLRMEVEATRAELLHWSDVEPALKQYVALLRNRLAVAGKRMHRSVPTLTGDDMTTVRGVLDGILAEFSESLESLYPPEPQPHGGDSKGAA